MEIIFWACLVVLLYTYFGYPLCMMFLSLFAKKTGNREFVLPSLSLIIPVYNEEKVIEKKIKNSLTLNYPNDKLEIIVASDCSTDNTRAIVEKYYDKGVKFFEFERAGKLATINRVIPYTKGEILVFTDANAMFLEDALLKLTAPFADESIGVVSGAERISKYTNNVFSIFEKIYWDYENKLKEWESRIYSTVGANGPIYAIRRELFSSVPSNLNVCDDMVISLESVKKGKRIFFEPKAVAVEETSMTIKEEWRRKIRIASQAWQSLAFEKTLLIPFKSSVALPLLFHKICRWSTFPLMAVLVLSNFFTNGFFYDFLLLFQIVFHTISIIGLIFLWNNTKLPIVSFLGYFFMTNFAQFIGLYKAIFQPGKPIWQPTQRG